MQTLVRFFVTPLACLKKKRKKKGAERAEDFDVNTFPADLNMHKEEPFT